MNDKKQKREQKQKHNDVVSSRISLYLVVTLCAVLVLMLLYRMVASVSRIPTYNSVVTGLVVLSSLALVLSIYRVTSSKGKDVSLALVTPQAGLFISTLAFLGSWFMKYYYIDALKLLFIALPTVCVLYIIRQVFGPGFYTLASYLAGACCLLYVLDRFMLMELLSSFKTLYGLLIIAFGIAGAFLFASASKGKGVASIFGKKAVLFERDAKYPPAYLACAAVAAVGALFIKSPSAAFYYGFAGMGGLILLFAIYYTYTLMYK